MSLVGRDDSSPFEPGFFFCRLLLVVIEFLIIVVFEPLRSMRCLSYFISQKSRPSALNSVDNAKSRTERSKGIEISQNRRNYLSSATIKK